MSKYKNDGNRCGMWIQKASVQGWQQSASLSQSELAWFNRHHWQNDVMWIRAGITRIKANYSKHCAVSDRVQKSNQELLNTGFQRPVLCSCIFIIVTITGHEQIQEWRKQVWNVNSKASVQGWQQSASLSQSELAWFNRHHWQKWCDVNPSRNNQNQGKLQQALCSFWPCFRNLIKNSSTLVFSVQWLCSCIFIIVTITGHEQIQEWRKQVWNVNSKASVQGWQQSASLSQSELAWFNRHHWQNDVMWIRAGITRIKANYSKHCAVSDRVQKSNQELLNTGFQRPVLCSCIFIIVNLHMHRDAFCRCGEFKGRERSMSAVRERNDHASGRRRVPAFV